MLCYAVLGYCTVLCCTTICCTVLYYTVCCVVLRCCEVMLYCAAVGAVCLSSSPVCLSSSSLVWRCTDVEVIRRACTTGELRGKGISCFVVSFSLSVPRLSTVYLSLHTHTHSSSLVLVLVMKAKELKTKISLTNSLILSQCATHSTALSPSTSVFHCASSCLLGLRLHVELSPLCLLSPYHDI